MSEVLNRVEKIGIVPVVKITEIEDALPMAQALYNGGIDCMEITFRSEFALPGIEIIAKELPDMLIGAGTVSSVSQAETAIKAGAQFIVTPGFNHDVVKWCVENDVLILPGISTASELETAISYGLTNVKFFPAESSGGAKKIKDLSAPYADITFMPTGGINAKNMHDYLALPCINAIGGSFMLPADAIAGKDWDTVERLSREAVDALLSYELIHIGFNNNTSEEAKENAEVLCNLFGFKYYGKPKSHFAGRGFEFLNSVGRGEHGHFGIYTPYPERALYQLEKKGIHVVEETITRNKKTNKINFAYLDKEIAGFAIHLINPDVKM
ncbi:bifunctional 4-hydroxy-2-oxoglutarate aldolase/2-dehydro-3-deoxy-phosphogluconate aldolase [Erysipelothrix rhusiopathiae]|uniref:bifunctional 4-hydroxy-2-oxoglutarate aldolase/2-dehydro-3-deoxy-phosphogluconate aldolase n=1 Tax=Erysipelothrix rhusiopathiae TaxID=1648 RepID=UPI002B248552|nr:bifunctional 4-hydroxy-2-oxoglutarate aldolase/2-dehydro-3-deoxy-phosphogluconate aldolase [Erysipelothrix rhusiopathiae]WRB93652.1 bifunctional 4-hydroxy-2-oxoglutarate aldolase/2-dehydro-3-deoxy-phosphogluconate aldolase [Erysipelothrix rhusiopathiae]